MSPLEVAITHSQLLQALQENNELKSHVVSTTSHEFRTPLSTILSSADLLEFYGDRVTPDKQLEHIQRIQNAAVNMNNLLSDILLIERADAKKLKCEPTEIEVRSFCQTLLTELRSGVEDSTSPVIFEVNFEGQAAETALAARLDAKLFRQILMNLLTNALKYSDKNPMVKLVLTVMPQSLTFTVSDRGMGIPKVDLDRLFEPFQRGSNVGTVPGNGLGMAIVKQSVQIHGGEVTVESEVGTGTVVTVRLPRMKNEE